MRLDELTNKKIVIWGTGREGLASARLILERMPRMCLTFLDENPQAHLPDDLSEHVLLTEKRDCEAALTQADVVIKSPGVSYYHPWLEKEKKRGLYVTSLLNIWCAENPQLRTIAITGTKGKSTTSSLLAHVLQRLGRRVALVGNIGVPVTECDTSQCDFCVIEVSSYQATNFSEICNIGVMVSLYPEHLNWHLSLEQYYRDKVNLLAHCKTKLCEETALCTLRDAHVPAHGFVVFNDTTHFHFGEDADRQGATRSTLNGENKEVPILFNGVREIGELDNAYLARTHNRGNVCAVMAVVKELGYPLDQALAAMESYKGLAHRQQEIGERYGVLYVDDSISTTPQSAVAAMQVYEGRPLTLIAGGQDRGIEYQSLVDYAVSRADLKIVCLGESGPRLAQAFHANGVSSVQLVSSMEEAIAAAKSVTPHGGVILLSPAAPSYDMFTDFIARAQAFASAAGFDDKP